MSDDALIAELREQAAAQTGDAPDLTSRTLPARAADRIAALTAERDRADFAARFATDRCNKAEAERDALRELLRFLKVYRLKSASDRQWHERDLLDAIDAALAGAKP